MAADSRHPRRLGIETEGWRGKEREREKVEYATAGELCRATKTAG
jgi:hypothetical protein